MTSLNGRGKRHSRLAVNVVTFFVVAATGCAQDRGTQKQGQQGDQKPGESSNAPATKDKEKTRRLENITWNPVSNQLTWVVSTAADEKAASNGSYTPAQKQTYEINMEEATMTYNGEKRRFSRQEAENVHVLMDILSKYAVESTVWWEDGQGVPLDKNGNPLPGRKKSNPDNLHATSPDDGALHAAVPLKVQLTRTLMALSR